MKEEEKEKRIVEWRNYCVCANVHSAGAIHICKVLYACLSAVCANLFIYLFLRLHPLAVFSRAENRKTES